MSPEPETRSTSRSGSATRSGSPARSGSTSRQAPDSHQPVGPEWAARALETLERAGHRSGGARRAVVELLAAEDCCLSAQEIGERLRGGGRRVGTASVYRALDLLHRIGLVQRVELGDGEARYEAIVPGGEHHHHAVCDRCGRVTAFEDEQLERAIGRLARRLDHDVRAHDVVIHGHCGRCDG